MPRERRRDTWSAPVRTQTRELVDLATVGDLEIANDAVLYMLLKKDGGDSWEVRDEMRRSPTARRFP